VRGDFRVKAPGHDQQTEWLRALAVQVYQTADYAKGAGHSRADGWV